MQKIDHNFVKLYRIPTKIGTEMHFNKPFMCIKCQLNLNMIHVLWAKMQSEQNEVEEYEKKNEEIISKFCSLVSRDWLV